MGVATCTACTAGAGFGDTGTTIGLGVATCTACTVGAGFGKRLNMIFGIGMVKLYFDFFSTLFSGCSTSSLIGGSSGKNKSELGFVGTGITSLGFSSTTLCVLVIEALLPGDNLGAIY